MSGFGMLDVMIGLVTVYLSFGIACTAIVEAFSSIAGLRSKNLRNGLSEFLQGNLIEEKGVEKSFVDTFYAHPLVQTLSKGAGGKPSYIPTKIVGRVVQSILSDGNDADNLKASLDKLPGDKPGENRIKDLLLEFYSQAKGDVSMFRNEIETHFDLSMVRVSGWFRRRTQYLTLFVALLLVVCSNVDTIEIARSLSSDLEARTAVVQSAEKLLSNQKEFEYRFLNRVKPENVSIKEVKKATADAKTTYDNAVLKLEQTGLNVGWRGFPQTKVDIFTKFIGLIVSIFAVSLGAPFWFQVLQRFMKIRGTGATPEKKSWD